MTSTDIDPNAVSFYERGWAAYRRGEQPASILDPKVVDAINALTRDERQPVGDKLHSEWTSGWRAAREAGEPRTEPPLPEPKPVLTITHTPAAGTVLDGTGKGDGTAAVLRNLRLQWRWSSNVGDDGAWYRQNTRDRRPTRYGIREAVERTAEALRAAGFEVAVEIGTERRSVAEQEADRAGRAEARVDGLDARAARLKASGEAGWAAAREYASHIPMGQPILVGHHSEGRHRRLLDKINGMDARAFGQLQESEDAAERAKASAAHQRHREHGATTMRRLEKLRADLRRAQRGLGERSMYDTAEEHAAKLPGKMAHWTPIIEELEERIAYWEQYLAALAEAGVYRVWTRADFAKGDYVMSRHGLMPVLRVNAKSLTVPHIIDALAEYGHTWTLPYDEVTGRRSAEDAAAEGGAP